MYSSWYGVCTCGRNSACRNSLHICHFYRKNLDIIIMLCSGQYYLQTDKDCDTVNRDQRAKVYLLLRTSARSLKINFVSLENYFWSVIVPGDTLSSVVLLLPGSLRGALINLVQLDYSSQRSPYYPLCGSVFVP